MRDLLIAALVFGLSAYTLKRPYIGVLLMSWLGYMNPHRLSWGFAYNMPFAFIATAATALALLTTKERSLPPNVMPVRLWVAFIVWVSISTATALYFDNALEGYIKFIKIQVGILFTLMLIRTPNQIKLLVVVIAYSIGFYGIKGGIFTLLTGGSFRVWGPPGSFIEDNNEIALAQLMVIPLMYFLFTQTSRRWLKLMILFSILLCMAAAVGSQSRGALLALICTSVFLWWESKHKLPIALIGLIIGMIGLQFLPEQWFARMETIQNYQQDASAMGRINAWTMGANLALDRIFGGGFNVYWSPEMFALYAPDPLDIHDAHSIYFEVLGEQGVIGLLIYLLLWLSTWRLLGRVSRQVRGHPEDGWVDELARMIKVSLVAYASGGAFLGLAYWDLPYHIFAIAVLLHRLVSQRPKAVTNLPQGSNEQGAPNQWRSTA